MLKKESKWEDQNAHYLNMNYTLIKLNLKEQKIV